MTELLKWVGVALVFILFFAMLAWTPFKTKGGLK